MKQINGIALIAIGLLHILVALLMPGIIGFSGVWQDIIEAGTFDAVKIDNLRIWGYYWFLVPGFFLILYGILCHWIENQLHLPLPAFVGWGLLIVSCFCILLDVDTGFWLVLLVAINAIAASQRAAQID